MAFTHDLGADRSLTLADGRTLGYCEFGDPTGHPVLNNHGGLVCRFDVELAHARAVELGVRLISPDRPGVATSDNLPGRDLLGWVDDVTQLMDALGVGDFANMGWSMGGQYALAVAHGLASRVTATAVIAGCLPLDDEDTFGELNEMDRKLTRLAQNHPEVARTEFALIGELDHLFPQRMAKLDSRKWSEADRELTLSNSGWLAAATIEAMRHTEGMVEEYCAWARPWGFALGELTGNIAIWQGTEDTLVPPAWARRMAEAVPGATLREVEGEGHLIAVSHRGEIIESLLPER